MGSDRPASNQRGPEAGYSFVELVITVGMIVVITTWAMPSFLNYYRLARVAGHANSLKRMWEEGRECDDMLTQIAAVRAALDQIGKVILEQHIEHCVSRAVKHGEAEEAIRDLRAALDRFV